MKRKRPYRLVSRRISTDTVKALETLRAEAMKGDIIGLAYVIMHQKQRNFDVGVAGECHRNPVFTRGMVKGLDDLLRDLSRKQSQ